ncbi:methyl-accepting chemotaxis protein [Acetobacterium tundrae]|uniref:HAMP domain-containing protein n=1 Tax=Acetobacterium tundrae TaxID=132932 RepID=A0ABR6WNA6_9FIRM|nr:methyl-accepting chemotaxis protein [Acetobacterium tundrae]MBC3797926.1 HAMP domain-containing protein [Acetobacterium tundrae]
MKKNEQVTHGNPTISTSQPKFGLAKKLSLFVIIGFSVVVLTLGIISVNIGTNAVLNQAHVDMANYAISSGKQVGAIISGNLATLDEVAAENSVKSMDWNNQVSVLSEDLNRLGYEDMAVVDMNGHGKYVISGSEFDIDDSSWFKDAYNGQNAVTDVRFSKVTNKANFYEIVPIKSNAMVVGLLIGRRDPTFMQDVVSNMGDKGNREYGFIISNKGIMMAHPTGALIESGTNVFEDDSFVSFAASYNQLDATKTSILNYDYNGESKIASAAPIPGTNWTIIYTIYQSDLMAPITNLRNITIIISLIILALGGFIGFIMSNRIIRPIVKIKDALDRLALGDVEITVPDIHTKDEVSDLVTSFRTMVTNRKDQTEVAQRLAAGDFSVEITPQSDKDVLSYSMISVIEQMNKLYDGISEIASEAREGHLDFRGNADLYPGSYKDFISGLNSVIDAFINPIQVSTIYMKQIGQGEIPQKITDVYKGDFNDLKNNINACIDGLDALVEGNRILGKMRVNDFTEKIKNEYFGIYGEIAKSINEVHYRFDHIVNISNNIANGDMRDLQELNSIGKRSDQDTLNPSLIKMIENIVMLVTETEDMAEKAVNGNLNNRGDADKFKGEFAKVISGINQTLDSILAPIMEASVVLGELSSGNLSTSMQGNYHGDHAKIKENLNLTITFLKRYVDEITFTLEALGQGNLNQNITSDYQGDFLAIKLALNGIANTLSSTMSDINIAAGQVEVGALQISDGGQALSQGTTEQASAIEQLTASIEEVASETQKNATSANEAKDVTIKVRNSAQKSNNEMGKMVHAMVEINNSSNNISKIIKVIDDIAFQTNILALNAAVEAARAGQHGKGFAVVAEEVRSLAARSAEAAKATTGLIEGSIDKVSVGSKIADETADSLKEILTEVEKVTNLVSNIAQASNDQASEIAQISQGIDQVSQVVQTNSATAEESAAASEELSGQAELLKQMVSTFTLKNLDGSKKSRSPKIEPSVSKKQNEKPIFEPQIRLDDFDADKY